MLTPDTRIAVLRLAQEGHSNRKIAETLVISRSAVRRVVEEGSPTRSVTARKLGFDPRLDRIRELFVSCRGNLIRVYEELGGEATGYSYASLTRFCRIHGIGVSPKKIVGTWPFAPGEEMQHDTSPHVVVLGTKRRLLQCASLVLCHSRLRFAQVYPTFNRFYCKTFLSAALQFFGGAARRCMIDNTSVILAGGSGKDAVISAEMEAFAKRFGFAFEAHAIGYAERSARVERSFHEIENNFYPGRTFTGLHDANAQLRAWCVTKNATFRRHLQASPTQLFAAEATTLAPLPVHVPDVVDVQYRVADTSGEVRLETNRYSVPDRLLGQRLELLVSLERIRVVHRHEIVADHLRAEDGAHARVRDPAHRTVVRREQRKQPLREEKVLEAAGPEFIAMAAMLRDTRKGRAVRAIRRLHKLYVDYPTDTVRACLTLALEHGLADLNRIERMILRRLGQDFFRLPTHSEDDDG
jgi:hypothetical protein